ncbi:FAD-binding oxidoreductase [Pseudomaricurvus alkylphenolicus]|uniref:FAD-binding oxidoreductase n=1 Tax=Pseudomaricurvus alkylphenolicus TaxID=1306991 RepID=UPI001421348C|nr:FAD-binding oxidoreductase [Pseudomaricurvus alkylphenolicus]NIB38563.1 FAD-binding oxidoreductase [Pseudomaricurvus alkylphenolicus]
MRRWNSWGEENKDMDAKIGPAAMSMLQELLGESTPLKDATLEEVIAKVPASRLPEHPLVSRDPEIRVRHARGQSLPDYLALRSGEVGVFPDGVAQPESPEDIQALLSFAKAQNIDVIPYGGGTSVVGHINPLEGDRPVLTISMARMNKLLSLDKESQIATFGAGTPGPLVESQLKAQGYTLGHYPQSWEFATLGGWIASRSSGQQSLRYGRIEQMFAGGRMETFGGTLEIPTFPASSAGPDIREMILGSEGRMGILSEVKVRVSPLPDQESFHVMFFPNWEAGVNAVRHLSQQRVQLSMMRLSNTVETTSHLRMADNREEVAALEEYLTSKGAGDNRCMLTFGVTGSESQCTAALEVALGIAEQYGGVDTGTLLGDLWAHGRFKGPYLREPLWQAGYAVDTMETAVDWCSVPATVEAIEGAIRNALADEDERVHVYTHLSHVYGQGCSIYTTYLFRHGGSFESAYQHWKKLKSAGAEQIVEQGGTISHQHGVGFDHKHYLPSEKGTLGMAAIQSLCDLFDPEGKMNPGKLL